jgi:hypothetical protein
MAYGAESEAKFTWVAEAKSGFDLKQNLGAELLVLRE